jgi:hypothetical protein
VNGVNVQKDIQVGIVIVVNGKVEAVRLRTLHIFTVDVIDHEHWWIQHWNGCSEKHMVILKCCIFCLSLLLTH